MINSGLMICSFYIKDKFSRKEDLKLLNKTISTSSEDYNNVFEIIKEFCVRFKDYYDDDQKMKMFSIDQSSISTIDENTYSYITFEINSGAYGIESRITNRKTREVKYKRETDDADIKKFHCVVFVPKDNEEIQVNKGIILFQTLGAFGVKSLTTQYIKSFLSELDLSFFTRSVSTRLFLEKLINDNKLQKITLIKNSINSDSTDNIITSTGREETIYYKPRIKESWVSKLLDFADGKRDQSDVFEINDNTYENIKLTFSVNDDNTRIKTVGLLELDNFSMVEEIPKSVFNNGKYKKETLIKYMIEKAEEYSEKIVFEVNEDNVSYQNS